MASNRKQETSEKIITTAIDLFSEYGYKGVTTEEIAREAGFSEKTLFRHFQSKQNLLEKAIDRYHYGEEMRTIFEFKLVWSLKEDLELISQNYHRIMFQNRKLLKMLMKIGENVPGIHQYSHRHPELLKEYLTNYFEEMKNREKIIPIDAEKMAITFLYMNFGFANGRMNGDASFKEGEFEKLLNASIALFIRGLTP